MTTLHTTEEILKNRSLLDGYKSRDNVKIQCDSCGEPFSRTKHHIQIALFSKNRRQSFCSQKCSGMGRRTFEEGECRECGKIVRHSPQRRSKTKNRFCSQSCAATYNNRAYVKRKAKPRPECKSGCGNRVKRSNYYCSSKCRDDFKYEKQKDYFLSGGDNGKHVGYGRSSWRRRLLEDIHGKKCNSCGISETYNKKPILLEVNHVDGAGTNNMIENLEFLCPNCHSQTETYKNNGARISSRSYRKKYHAEKMKRKSEQL